MKLTLRHVIGAARIFRRRSVEVGQPGLAQWGETVETAAADVSGVVTAAAHANECAETEMAGEVAGMLADGRIDAEELARLQRLPRRLTRCAERSHDISDAVKL